jgi:hypothetical protein
MTERPILFSTAMVQAILSSKKTQTRRIVKSQSEGTPCFLPNSGKGTFAYTFAGRTDGIEWHLDGIQSPYGIVGDRLWVRETWREDGDGFAYKADDERLSGKWKPSIHMPKKACRLRLEIQDIRVERLKDISEEDAISEGISYFDFAPNNRYGWNWHWGNPKSYEECFSSPQNAFGGLWVSINGEDSYDANPWVWIIKFSKTTQCQAYKDILLENRR